MSFGHEFGQDALVAQHRYEAYRRDADAYRLMRSASAGRRSARARTLGDRLGAILLAWGCRLCERRGTVTVRIHLERRSPSRPTAA